MFKHRRGLVTMLRMATMNNFTEGVELRQCKVCQELKPLTKEFFCLQGNPAHFLHRCKSCDSLVRSNRLSMMTSAPCADGHKRCTKCKQVKPADKQHFSRHHNGKGGLYAQCLECTRSLNSIYRGENSEKAIIRTREYRRQFPEKVQRANRDYESRYPEKKKLWQDKWKDANRDRMRQVGKLNSNLRRARQKALPNMFTDADYERCMDYWGHACAITGETDKVCLDHWIPLANPDCIGTVPLNIIPLSFKLNCSKKNREPVEWLKWKFGEEKAMEILTRVQAYFDWLLINASANGENAPYV